MHQCLDETQFESVIALTQAGMRPCTVLSSLLQQDPDTAASSRSISNDKTKRRTEYLSGQSPIQALLQSLQKSDWKYNYEMDAENHINALFCTPKFCAVGKDLQCCAGNGLYLQDKPVPYEII